MSCVCSTSCFTAVNYGESLMLPPPGGGRAGLQHPASGDINFLLLSPSVFFISSAAKFSYTQDLFTKLKITGTRGTWAALFLYTSNKIRRRKGNTVILGYIRKYAYQNAQIIAYIIYAFFSCVISLFFCDNSMMTGKKENISL